MVQKMMIVNDLIARQQRIQYDQCKHDAGPAARAEPAHEERMIATQFMPPRPRNTGSMRATVKLRIAPSTRCQLNASID